MAQRAYEDDAAERLRLATEVLESVADDPGLLAGLSVEERTRLLTAAGNVFNPDPVRRRRAVKEASRARKRSKADRDESVLAETGIRVLRDKPVFTTPNVFPPKGFEPEAVDDAREFGELVGKHHCYVCKTPFTEIHPFYDQMCRSC